MSVDFVALCRERPDRDAVLGALLAACAELEVRADGSGVLIELLDRARRPLFAVEGPILVQVPGETERLLGLAIDLPVWWVEIRAVSDRDEAADAARRFASRLVEALGGTVWPQ